MTQSRHLLALQFGVLLLSVYQEIAKLDNARHHLANRNIGTAFLQSDGILRASLMPDFLHLNESAYRIWATAKAPKLAELLTGQ